MEAQLRYLKSVVEGEPNVERWVTWFARNDEVLQAALSRGEYLRLKLNRIKAIPEILEHYGITFVASERYSWLGGIEGVCRDCGAKHQTQGGFTWCPNGCFRMHGLRR